MTLCYQKLYALDKQSGADMHTSRAYLASCALDHEIYAAGGINVTGALDTFEIYDSKQDEWRELKALPTPIHRHGLACFQGKVYLAGGYLHRLKKEANDLLWVYDPKLRQWQSLARMPGVRTSFNFIKLGNFLLVIGGEGENPKQIWAYNIKSNLWHDWGTPMPSRRDHFIAAYGNKLLFVVGGNETKLQSNNLLYDLEQKKWNKLSKFIMPRSAFAGGFIKGKLLIIGGQDSANKTVYGSSEILDIKNQSWQQHDNNIAIKRHGMASTVIDDKLYVMGGATKSGMFSMISTSKELEIFSIDDTN